MNYAFLLNDKQYQAVTTDSQYVRIIAGAGSGKTRVLTYRIAYLITNKNVDPSRILAISFTNKVAREMNERATKLIEENVGGFPILHISTFHALCSRFLRIEHAAINYPQSYTIYDEDDQSKLIRNCAAELGYKKGDDMVKVATRYIRNKKGKGIYPEDIRITPTSFREEQECLKIYMSYEKRKEDAYALDFDDLLCKTIEILENNENIRDKWSHRFDHILVDEFQDTNDVQYKLLKLLTTSKTNVYVVGDPDQTIYTWRGANQQIILDFDHYFPHSDTIILNENYRSTKKILAAANKLIMHNKNRVPKDLFTNGNEGDEVTTFMAPSSADEADWVAKKIVGIANEHKKENGEPVYDNIAILYRSSYMTRPFEAALKDRGIPYKIFGGVRFYERMEVKDLLAYFNLLLNPLDDIAFERIVNVPKRKIGDASIERIRREAKNAGLSEYNYMKNLDPNNMETEIPSRVVNILRVLIAQMEGTKAKLTDNLEAYSAVLKDFVTEIGYYDYLKENEEPDEDRIGNVNALFDDINHFISNHSDSTFAEYLQNVSLLTSQDDINGGNFVSLMTIHVAKGLEFDNVFVICMNEGSFPSQRSLEETGRDAEEEERRLAYVAMTRAKKRLFCSCNSGYSYVTDSSARPSCYFQEAGLKLNKTGAFFSESSLGGWKKKRSSGWDDGFFSDESNDDFFDEMPKKKTTPKPKPVAKPSTNGIHNWKVGDVAHHEKFGDGVVVSIVDANIIVIDFGAQGKKTLLGSHPMLSRIKSAGGDA